MGTLVFFSADPAVLPSVSSNAQGETSWSGLPVAQLTPQLMEDLYRYCLAEGRRQGWNDVVNDRVGCSRNGPFHQDLLNGEPLRIWQQSYDDGVREHAEYKASVRENADGR